MEDRNHSPDARETGRDLAARTRAAQGLPPTIDDADALRGIAAIAAGAMRRSSRGQGSTAKPRTAA